MAKKTQANPHHVVIVGGGFGGLYTAQALRKAPVRVTLIDKRNFHLFQPLLYQVATGGLAPDDIASPLRTILSKQANANVVQGEVVDLDPAAKTVTLNNGTLTYDSLILATGAANHYFGHDDWESQAPGLKTIEDAITIRRQILLAFEAAEREVDPEKRKAWLTFVIIGGGPTGVELAGAIAELASHTLEREFTHIHPSEATVLLLEKQSAILPPYPAKSASNAQRALERLGVTVQVGASVEQIDDSNVRYVLSEGIEIELAAHTVLWAAGMKATPLTKIVADRTGAELDRSGRIMVDQRLHLADDSNIFAIGDMAHCVDKDGQPLPGVAPVAMQQGQYVARLIEKHLAGRELPAFNYRDKGNLAVIGRNAAVGVLGKLQISGFPAWLAWSGIHLWYLIQFDRKMLVLLKWSWSYFTRGYGTRLIYPTESLSPAKAGEQALPKRTAVEPALPMGQ